MSRNIALSCCLALLTCSTGAWAQSMTSPKAPPGAQAPAKAEPAKRTEVPAQLVPGQPNVSARPAGEENPVPARAIPEIRTASRYDWGRVDLHWNMLYQSSTSYSSALGLAYTPRYRLGTGFTLGLSVGAELAKSHDGSKAALLEIGPFLETSLEGKIFLRPELGIANPVPKDATATKALFPYFGLGLGYRIGGREALARSAALQYSYLLSDTKTHQFVLAVGFGW